MKQIIIEKQLTFKKEEKLKSKKLIEILFKQGNSFSVSPFKILYLFPDKNISILQSGFAVSGKNFKRAVDRNRIKRLMREAYRLQKNILRDRLKKHQKFMTAFFIYTGKEIPPYKLVFDKIGSALNKLNIIADEATAADT